MSTWVNGHLRPLPRPVTPFRDETVSSYLRRLAHANRLDEGALRVHLTGSTSQDIPAERLAAVSAHPVHVLRSAMLELCEPHELAEPDLARRPAPGHQAGRVCRFCALARGVTEVVIRWKEPEDILCRRHRRWLVNQRAAVTGQYPDLSRQPGILRAHRRHRDLLRRHGRDQTRNAVTLATNICKDWHNRGMHDEDFHRRMRVFHGPGWSVDRRDPTLDAAIYPQTVALTRLLTSPHWRAFALERPARLDRFLVEVRRTVAPTYQWDATPCRRSYDALVNWVRDHRAYPRDPPLPLHLVERRTSSASS